jgi:hypothetical protein
LVIAGDDEKVIPFFFGIRRNSGISPRLAREELDEYPHCPAARAPHAAFNGSC